MPLVTRHSSLVTAPAGRSRHSSLVTAPTGRRGVLLGAWGHFGEVLDEMDAASGALELAGIAAVREEDGDIPAAQLVAEHSCAAAARIADDAEALLRGLHPDFAVVSARPDRIPRLGALAAAYGCHIVTEKPLALDFDSLRALQDAVAAAGVRVCAMLPNRARPPLAAAISAIHAGAIGRPLLLNARKTYKWGASRPAWFGDRAAYGGTIPWIGIHALDFIDAATDGDPLRDVSAFHANLAHEATSGCEDVCVLAMRLQSGALATATLDYLRPDAPVPHGDDGLRIVGARGELTVDIDRNRAVLLEAGAAPRELPLPAPEPYYAPWLLTLPPRGAKAAPDDRTLRAFRLTDDVLRARQAADAARGRRVKRV